MVRASCILVCLLLPAQVAWAFVETLPMMCTPNVNSITPTNCMQQRILRARPLRSDRKSRLLASPRMQFTAETQPKKVLPLVSGGNLIIAERGWILETSEGADEYYGDQAIPIELDDQLAWLLYRDGEVVLTVTDDDIDAIDPMIGGSEKITDPLSIARNTPAGGILNLFGAAMNVLRPNTDRGLLSRWAAESEVPENSRMSRAIADVQKEVETLSLEEEEEEEVPPPLQPTSQTDASAAEPTGDEAAWVAARREGVLLVNEAQAKMMGGLLAEAKETARTAMAIFSAEAERGVAAAGDQKLRAERVLQEAQRAEEGQASARAEAVRLAKEAKEWLQAGDLQQALSLAESAQASLQEVEACYGRVSALELTTVLEIRVRAEEKAQMRREAEAAATDEAQAATRKRQEAEKRQQEKLAAKKKEEARQGTPASSPVADVDDKTTQLEAWREPKNLGASLNRGARLALKAGKFEEALGLAEEAALAFKEAAAMGYRKGDAEARASRSLAERARLAKGTLDANRAGSVSAGTQKRKVKEDDRANDELESLFAVEAYAAATVSDDEQETMKEKEETARREEEEARARAEEEERQRAEALRAEADAVYQAMAAQKRKEEAEKAKAEAEATLARWIEEEEERAREEEEARARAEAEARANAAIEAKKQEEEEARRRQEEEKERREKEEVERVVAEERRRKTEELQQKAAAAAEQERQRAEEEEQAREEKEEAQRVVAAQPEAAGFGLGSVVEARFYEDNEYYKAQVLTAVEHGKQWVLFIGYGDEQDTSLSDMRLPKQQPPATPTSTKQPPAPPAVALRPPPRPAPPAPELRENARQGSIGAVVQGTQMVSVGVGGEPIAEKRYEMPVKYHGVLLGKQGLTVKAMEKASGAQIRFEKEPVGAIVIKGTEPQRQEAWKLVQGMQATLPKLLNKLRQEPIKEGELRSRPTLQGRIEDKQAVWPVAVSEALARVRDQPDDDTPKD